MVPYNYAALKKVSWQEIREEVAKTNIELAKIIDELSPGPEYTLYKAHYPFGSEILKKGIFHLPNKHGTLAPLNDPTIDPNLQEELGYNFGSNPVSIILKKSAEMCMLIENNTIPMYGLIPTGRIFGTWRILSSSTSHSPAFLWNMTAGARSLFMLPKISETAGYNKLRKEFHLQVDKPNSLIEHWSLFREIANHPNFGERWETEILFFSKKWFTQLDDKKWLSFKIYLLQMAWDSSDFLRNQFIWDIVFSVIQRNRNIKPDPYRSEIVRHLLAIGVGALPGFAPVINDDSAPIKKIQEVFIEIYKLEHYSPIIMQPHIFSYKENRPVYYSLQYPTTTKFSLRTREGATKIFDLHQIMMLLNKYLTDIQENKLNLNGTPIYELSDKLNYDFFHTDRGDYTGIRLSKEMPMEDFSFNYVVDGKEASFPANSTFVRGCIRITCKN